MRGCLDAAVRPTDQWRAAGQSKGLWLAVIAVTWFVGLGWLAGLVYLLPVRPKRRAAVV